MLLLVMSFVFLFTNAACDSLLSNVEKSFDSPKNTDSLNKMYLEFSSIKMSKNITTKIGKTVYMNCDIKNVESTDPHVMVTWFRRRDFHVLTIGSYRFTQDSRFHILTNPYTKEWTLQLKYPKYSDSGIYECQISATNVRKSSKFFNLIVDNASSPDDNAVVIGKTTNSKLQERRSFKRTTSNSSTKRSSKGILFLLLICANFFR